MQMPVGWRTVSPAEKQNTIMVQHGAAASVNRLTLTRFSHCISFLVFFFLPPMKIKFVSSISVFIYLFLGVSSP